MAFDYDTLVQPIVDDIDTNYTGYKNYFMNQMKLDIYWDKSAIVGIYASLAEQVIVYLAANHSGKKFLECFMSDGLVKYYNEDPTNGLATPLDIKSASHLADWHSAVVCSRTGDTTSDMSDAAAINEDPDDHNGFFFIKLKEALGVQANYCRTARPTDGNYPTDWIQATPNDATAIDLNTFDMLLMGQPDTDVFNNVANFKTKTGYTGSILFYDVGFESEEEEARKTLILSDIGLTASDLKYPLDSCVLANLPTHTVIDLGGHPGYLIS